MGVSRTGRLLLGAAASPLLGSGSSLLAARGGHVRARSQRSAPGPRRRRPVRTESGWRVVLLFASLLRMPAIGCVAHVFILVRERVRSAAQSARAGLQTRGGSAAQSAGAGLPTRGGSRRKARRREATHVVGHRGLRRRLLVSARVLLLLLLCPALRAMRLRLARALFANAKDCDADDGYPDVCIVDQQSRWSA